MPYELPPLPYEMNALEPHMSKETLEYHYGKHHKTYVDNLNKLVPGTEWEGKSLEEITKKATGPIFNNGAQIWNHTFFWNCLSPKGGGQPTGALAEAINANFGSFDAFKEKFSDTSVKQFASGWGWLVKTKEGKLEILSTSNAGNPMTDGKTPLMTCDVWEHAYYIDYRNKRPDFLGAFWKLVNWEFVSKNFSNAK
ncbi:superoxide dismutase [Bdellovibrio bacteriovorus]|uniref:Superoxide dismutase n=1 Tax=Bdellovibrio bacteriovorus TaxID=959 RepID=A0A150WRT6_BDEBC|nr:superoxide dismutase [Bdellovibrio bacteriovorus]KYG66979.1 superoxide dismutase [Bdellovibrio bacteriovorus]